MVKSRGGKAEEGLKKVGAGWRLFVRLSGWFSLAALMFTLGVLTGRGSAPVRFDMEKLEKRLDGLSAAAFSGKGGGGSGKPVDPGELEFYDALKNSEDLRRPIRVKKAFPKKMKKKVPPKKNGVSVAAAKPPSGPQRPSAKKAAVSKPAPPEKKSAQKAAAKKPVAPKAAEPSRTKGRYSIQVAALKEREVAEKLVAKLVGKGFPAYAVRSRVPGKGTWHRVRVGAFVDRTGAQGTLGRLKKEGVAGFLVNR